MQAMFVEPTQSLRHDARGMTVLVDIVLFARGYFRQLPPGEITLAAWVVIKAYNCYALFNT